MISDQPSRKANSKFGHVAESIPAILESVYTQDAYHHCGWVPELMANCGQAFGPQAWACTGILCPGVGKISAIFFLRNDRSDDAFPTPFDGSSWLPYHCGYIASQERLHNGIDLPAFSLEGQVVFRLAWTNGIPACPSTVLKKILLVHSSALNSDGDEEMV
jgi:hypothetical protein